MSLPAREATLHLRSSAAIRDPVNGASSTIYSVLRTPQRNWNAARLFLRDRPARRAQQSLTKNERDHLVKDYPTIFKYATYRTLAVWLMGMIALPYCTALDAHGFR